MSNKDYNYKNMTHAAVQGSNIDTVANDTNMIYMLIEGAAPSTLIAKLEIYTSYEY
jgi:hypothetical protein